MDNMTSGTSALRLRLLVTIGIPLGLSPDPDSQQRVAMLRHGRDLLNFDIDAYQVLLRGGHGATRDQLMEWAQHRNIAEPASVIERCVDAGLLREVDFSTQGGSSNQWAELRIHPVGIGMGVDDNNRGHIEVPRRDGAEVERLAYSLWAASDGRSIQQVLDAMVASVGANRFALSAVWADSTPEDFETFADAVVNDPTVAPRLVAQSLPGAVFELINQGAAYLDVIP